MAQQLNNRFVRVTRADRSALYVSGNPKESSFDPSAVSAVGAPVGQDFVREVHAPGGESLFYTRPRYFAFEITIRE